MDEAVAMEFAADVESAVASVRELATSAQGLADTAKEAADGVAGLAAPAEEAGAAIKGVADAGTAADGSLTALRGAIEANTGAVTQLTDATIALKDAQAEAAAAADKAGAANEGAAAKTGAAAEAGLGKYKMALVGIGVGAAVAVDAAGKFQDQTTHLVTDAGESAKNLAMVQQGILGVSASTGTSASQITDAMYHIESSGFHAASGLAILKTTAEGAKVGGADLDTTSKALVGTLTAYYGTSLTAGQATKDSTSLMNQLITTVGSGDMRMQDLASSLSNVTPVAAAAGISFAQVGGAIATMTSQGMSARQATQNLAHAIRSLSAPTNVQAVEMKAMGLSANEVAKNLGKTGLAGTFQELSDAVLRNTKGGDVILNMMRGMSPEAKGLSDQILAGSISTHDLTSAMKELNPQQYALVSHFKATAVSVTGMKQTYTSAMSKMLGGATGLNVGLMLTGTHMKDLTSATKNIAAEGKKASDTVDNWSTIQGTFKFKVDQAKASLEDTGIALGSALLPAVTAVLGPIAHFLALIAGNKAAAIALAAVVGTILAGAIGTKAVHALTSFKDAMKTAVDGVQAAAGWVKKLAGASDEQVTASKKAGDAAKASAAEQEAASAGSAAAAEEGAAAQEAAGEGAWKSSGDLAAKSAAAQEAAAESSAGAWEVSAAQEEAAWAEAEAAAETSAAETAAAGDAAAGEVATANEVAAATSSGSWIASAAAKLAAGVAWVAENTAKVAVVVAENIAGAAVTAAAWVAANALMLLGIGLIIAAVVIAVVEIVKHWKSIVHGVEEAFDEVKHVVLTAVDAVVGFVKEHWMLLLGILLGPIALAVALIATYWGTIKSDAEKFVSDVTSTISRFASDVLGFFERMSSDVTGAERKMISAVISDVKGWISDFLSTVESGLDNIVKFFEGLPGRIVSGLGNMASLLVNVGKNIVIGLVNGIESMGSFLANAILSLIPSPIRGIVETALGMASPSKVFHGYGQNIVQGLINGVQSMQPHLRAAMTTLAGGVTATGSAYAASAIAPASGSTSVHVTVPVTATGTAGDMLSSPQYKQALQAAVQTVTLEYAQMNPGNGLSTTWGR